MNQRYGVPGTSRNLRAEPAFTVAIGDVILIKRLELLPHGKIHVLSDNDAYVNYTADPEEIRIIGERIWYGRTCV